MKKYILLGITLASLSFSWGEARWERTESNTRKYTENDFYDTGESNSSFEDIFVEKNSIYFINAMYGDEIETEFNTNSEKWEKYLTNLGKVIVRIDSNDSGSKNYEYGVLYGLNKERIILDYPGINPDEYDPKTPEGRKRIYDIVNRYPNDRIDNIFSNKLNKNGTSINNDNNSIWRNILGIEENNETNNKINKLANRDAENILGDDINKWREKLSLISSEKINILLNNKIDTTGNNLLVEDKEKIRNSLNIYSKEEENSIFNNKVDKEGNNLSEIDKEKIKNSLNIYSKEKENEIFNNKVDKEGNNLLEIDKEKIRNNLEVYSKEEQNKLNYSKVNKDGSNLIGEENREKRESWKKNLEIIDIENFDNKYNSIVNNVEPVLMTINNELQTEEKKINSGIASAIAVANLPQPVNKEDKGIMIGVGNYKNEVGISLGYSKIFKKDTIFKISTGIDTQKSSMFNLSIGRYIRQ